MASGGLRSRSLRIARDARPRALDSRYLPRVMKVRIMAASVKYIAAMPAWPPGLTGGLM